MQYVKEYIKEHPFLFDRLFKFKRMLNRKDPIYKVLDNYSRKRNNKIKFIYGLANNLPNLESLFLMNNRI